MRTTLNAAHSATIDFLAGMFGEELKGTGHHKKVEECFGRMLASKKIWGTIDYHSKTMVVNSTPELLYIV